MDGLLMAWEGDFSWKSILANMAREVTGPVGDAQVYMVVDDQSEKNTCNTTLTNAGVDMSEVFYVVRPTDTIWIRDYGPRYIYQGGCRAIVDHTYNRPRPLDDAFPSHFSNLRQHPLYDNGLIHGGGNFHLDSIERSYATRLINNENQGLTEAQIIARWFAFQNVNTTLFNPFPQNIDSTQHLDMWMQIIADNKVVISDWPTAQGSTQDQICERAASLMAQRGYTVYRTPALSISSHFTYTNAVMCNDLVMIPKYSQQGMSSYNAQALATWESAMPDKDIVQIDATNIISAAGALHCIVMHVPKNLNGAQPGVYLIGPQGGSPEFLLPGQQVEIEWLADDDSAVTAIDLWMDAPFGSTRPVPIIRNTTNDGTFIWTVPSASTLRRFKLRVDAKDAQGNTATSYSSGTFRIQ